MGLRVLHLIDSGGLYGAERMLLTLVEEQIGQGLQPTILSAGEHGVEEKAIEKEARRRQLPLLTWRMRPGFNLRQAKKIVKWAHTQDFQILHSHGYKFDVLLAILPRSIRRIPLVSTVHGYVKAPFPSKAWGYESLDRLALRRFDAVVLVAQCMQEYPAIAALPDACRWIIPNGLPAGEVPSQPLPVALADFRRRFRHCLVAVGRLSSEKEFAMLLRSFAKATANSQEIGLALIGSGGLEGELKELAQQLAISERVSFPGYIEGAGELLPHFDFLVISSRTEGLPIVLLEAMRARVPVIATAVGAIPDVLQSSSPEPGGVVIPPEQPEALTNALAQLLDVPERGGTYAARAYRAFKRDYSASKMALRYKECYVTILGRARGIAAMTRA